MWVQVYGGRIFPYGSTDTHNWTATCHAFRLLFSERIPGADRKPLYPALSALVDLFVDQILLSGQIVSMVCGVLTVVGVYMLGAQLFGRGRALLCAVGLVVYYRLLLFSTFNEGYVTLACASVFLAHYALLAVREGKTRHYVFAGLASACCVLTVYWGLLVPLVIVPFVVIASCLRWRSIPLVGLKLAAFAAVMAPLVYIERYIPKQGTPNATGIDFRVSSYLHFPFQLDQFLLGVVTLRPDDLALLWYFICSYGWNLLHGHIAQFYIRGPLFLAFAVLALMEFRHPRGAARRGWLPNGLNTGSLYLVLLHTIPLTMLCLPYQERYALHIEPFSFMLLTVGVCRLWDLTAERLVARLRDHTHRAARQAAPVMRPLALALIVLGPQLWIAASLGARHSGHITTGEDSSVHEMATWIGDHVPEDAIVMTLGEPLTAGFLLPHEQANLIDNELLTNPDADQLVLFERLIDQACEYERNRPMYMVVNTHTITTGRTIPRSVEMSRFLRADDCFEVLREVELDHHTPMPVNILLCERLPAP